MPDFRCCIPGCKAPIPKPHILCMAHFGRLSTADRQEIRKRCFGWSNPQAAINWAIECFEQKERQAQNDRIAV